MTKVEESKKTCNDCELPLFFYNPAQVYGCKNCQKAWSMETIKDWSDSTEMPSKQYDYSEYFN
jgi:hypothetical protein